MADKRFIEVSFPVKEVSKEAVREKSIRQGNISTLHIWWARKPLASSRATTYASLIAASGNAGDLDKKMQFITDLSKWESSLDYHVIETARKDILDANNGKPRVLDPFAGGGAIPLEGLRLGCETYAGDYNPVATLLLKATLEYPQRYESREELGKDKSPKGNERNSLVEDVQSWANWVLKEVKKEIERFYPKGEDGSTSVGYIWAKTIPCQNPSCGTEIPLMYQLWLAKKTKKRIALKPLVNEGGVDFKIVKNPSFDPSKGTVKRAVVRCLSCGSTVDGNTTRKIFQEGKSGQRMVVVVLHHPGKSGKTYRIATKRDMAVFQKAEKHLEMKTRKLKEEWGIEPVPDEETPEGKGRGAERAFSLRNYGLNAWGDLFNARQKLAVVTFAEKARQAHNMMIQKGYDKEYAKAVVSYLALAVDRLASYNTNNAYWHVTGEKATPIFGREALPIIWSYAETNPFSASFSWKIQLDWIVKVIDHCSKTSSSTATVSQFSATSLPFPECFFDAVLTDPPYYDNVPYADMSDFFYVWLKRVVGDLYPDLFPTPLTPKSKEIIAHSLRAGGWEEAKQFVEKNLRTAFQEIYRVLKPGGIATIVYAHKSTSGWETLINSLLDSGLIVTASWPIHTEMEERPRARESAVLASSIYIVARKMKREQMGWYNEVREEIKRYVYDKLERLWHEGISGADYFIAAIGSAIEIFGKYEKIMDYGGDVVRADRLIDYVRDVVTDYVVRQLLHNGIAGELTPLTKFYLLWRWTYQDKTVHFDDARKLAQSTGIDLASEWNKGFIVKSKEFIKVMGPHERGSKVPKEPIELIDVLHRVLVLWREGKKVEMNKVLQESGWGNRDAFYRIAQAISETLPLESKEKKLLDGFLSGKEQVLEEVKKVKVQTKLFES